MAGFSISGVEIVGPITTVLHADGGPDRGDADFKVINIRPFPCESFAIGERGYERSMTLLHPSNGEEAA